MTQPTPTLDVERIIRTARLRAMRGKMDTAMSIMLFQCLHRRDPETKILPRMLVDEGRDIMEQLFIIDYRGQLWSIQGAGTLEQIAQRAQNRTPHQWKNPRLMPFKKEVEDGLVEEILRTEFPLSQDLARRIEAATCQEEARVMAEQAPKPTARRPSNRI